MLRQAYRVGRDAARTFRRRRHLRFSVLRATRGRRAVLGDCHGRLPLGTGHVVVYCLIDEWLRSQPAVRRCGLAPLLSDSEVLTMAIVDEYPGIDTDTG